MPKMPKRVFKPVAVVTPKKGVPAVKTKRAKGYQTPIKIPLGATFKDLSRQEWVVGKSIGSGGFGDIYSARKIGTSIKQPEDYPFALKIEPHGNGPLFVEMHFYSRNAQTKDIEEFRKTKGLKSIGMSHFVGHGSHDLQEIKHRFVVMPRYGKDIWSIFLENGRQLPQHTIYRIAMQMLYVLEYIHKCTYIHGDIKGANILLGFDKKDNEQTYLIDFGLACHYTTQELYKPDPKKMHNGTIEYTSRDAHNGVATMRGDLEILGFNVLQWQANQLPWEQQKLLTNPSKVQAAKEELMNNLDKSIKLCLPNADQKTVNPILNFLKYVQTLKFNAKPDYDKCRKFFETGLKELKKLNTGPLDFKITTEKHSKPIVSTKETTSAAVKEADKNSVIVAKVASKSDGNTRRVIKKYVIDSSEENIATDESDDEESSTPQKNQTSKRKRDVKASPTTPNKKIKGKPIVAQSDTPLNSNKEISQRQNTSSSNIDVINEISAKGKKSNKTYQFNFELDVSLDANVIVNVKRKKKTDERTKSSVSPNNKSSQMINNDSGTPIANMRVVKNSNKEKAKKK